MEPSPFHGRLARQLGSRLGLRLAISTGLIAALVGACVRLPHINDVTVALMIVLGIVGLARMWGWAEALTAAIVGGIGFDYYFLGPPGFAITAPEHAVALAAFSITAIVTGQLTAQLKRGRIDAVNRHNEMDTLYRVSNALSDSSSAESWLERLADTLTEILGANGVALYDKQGEKIVRAGPRADIISDEMLRMTATSHGRSLKADLELSLARICHGGKLVGSMGVSGAMLPEGLFGLIASRIGVGLVGLYAISEATRAEVLRRSEELKSAALDSMAHEIRTPLNSAKLAATTLLSGRADSEAQKQELAAIIDEELDRMDHFIDETVRIARLEAEEFSLQKEPQQLAQLIPSAIGEIRALAGNRPIKVSIPEWLPSVECDKDMIARVLRQLLGNALKYSPEGTPLAVLAELTGEAIVIDVVDHGPGIADEERDRIFEKYYRGRAAGSSIPGTGLGLASARSIAQAHGGEIWVTTSPGGGAAFHISLPVRAAKPMATARPAAGARSDTLGAA